MSRAGAILCFGVLVVAGVGPGTASSRVLTTQAQVERAVIASIPAWRGQRATILRYLSLSESFDTVSPSALVVAQDPHQRQDAMFDKLNPILVCMVAARIPQCAGALNRLPTFSSGATACTYEPPCYSRIYRVASAKVVFAGVENTRPLLLLKAHSMSAPNGSTSRWTLLYRYERDKDRFRAVFVHAGGGNNNQHARFVASGPLQGDEVVDFPTEHAPYVYWVEVYAPHGNGPYHRILRYRSSTHYADGNPLSVADSEMAGIMRRLGMWKPGDPLPVPQSLPADCGRLVLRHGEEWCQNLR